MRPRKRIFAPCIPRSRPWPSPGLPTSQTDSVLVVGKELLGKILCDGLCLVVERPLELLEGEPAVVPCLTGIVRFFKTSTMCPRPSLKVFHGTWPAVCPIS